MEQEETKNEVVKTLLKFRESEINGDPIAFAHVCKNGYLIGVHDGQTHMKKRICVLSKNIDKSSVKFDTLYEVTMSNMSNFKGYIVESMLPVKHKAKVYTEISKNKCQAVLAAGYYKIYYNPLGGKSDFSNTSEGALSLVEKSKDIVNKEEAAIAFKRAIDTVDRYISKLPEGKVETLIMTKCFYQATVSFGNQKIVYNPFDGKPHESDLNMVMKRIDNVLGFKNKKDVKRDVLLSARNINLRMKADGYILPKQIV